MTKDTKKSTLFAKGICVGIGTLIPGLSGGTVALIVNVFEEIIEAIANINTHFIKSIKTLVPISLGAILGIFLCSYPISIFCIKFPIISKYFFCFISLISFCLFVKNSMTYEFTIKKFLFFIIGTISAYLIALTTQNFQVNLSSNNALYILAIGLILSIALILPGISFSYMLLFFGIYESTLKAISNIDLIILLPLGTGIILGSFLFSKVFLRIIEKYKENTYAMILGFILFSLAEILA